MFTRRTCRPIPALALLCAAMLTACERSTSPQPQHGTAQLYVQAVFSAANVPTTVVVEISAADISPTLIYNLPVANDTAKGTVTIPAGDSRAITISGYDAKGVKTYTGTQTVNVQVGANTSVNIPLTSSGQQPIVATFSSFTVSVSPTTTTLSLATSPTGTIAVTVKASDGSTITPAANSVACATDNPAIATVTVGLDGSSCAVTGKLAGSTTIMATYSGIGASSAITVTP